MEHQGVTATLPMNRYNELLKKEKEHRKIEQYKSFADEIRKKVPDYSNHMVSMSLEDVLKLLLSNENIHIVKSEDIGRGVGMLRVLTESQYIEMQRRKQHG